MSFLLRQDKSSTIKSSSSITADELVQFFADEVTAMQAETKDAAPPTFT